MVVVISRAPGTKARVVVPDGLEAGEGIGEYADPFMVLECSESRMYGDELRPHDGSGLFCPRCVNEYDSGGWYMYHRRSKSWVALNVGAVRVNPVFWDKFRCPWVRDWWGGLPSGREIYGCPCEGWKVV